LLISINKNGSVSEKKASVSVPETEENYKITIEKTPHEEIVIARNFIKSKRYVLSYSVIVTET